jgi:hypothetical protein
MPSDIQPAALPPPVYGDFMVFVDESGDHGLANCDPAYPVFVLAFCIIRKSEYIDLITPAVQRFKKLCAESKIIWDSNAMRHSFGSYHFGKHGNSIETARILGHKGDDTVLFAHYRALTTKAQGDAYFAIMPATTGQVIAFPPAAAQ